MNQTRFLLYIILIIVGQASFAMPDDRDKVAQLSANTADLNQQTHRGEYLGNVQFDQGTTHLRAAKAITQGNQQNKLTFAIAIGDKRAQAHYWEQVALDKPILHAYADEIHYYPDKHLIELIGSAHVVQGNNSFAAPKISYDTLNKHVISKNEGNARTTIIFHPEKKA